jgi:diguanylate cyclase (GGDEF)-like protein
MDGDVLDSLLLAAPVALVVTDGAGRCTHFSERFARLVGTDPRGDAWIANVVAEDRPAVAGAVARAAALGIAATVHCRIGHTAEHERWIELELAPRVDDAGTPMGAIGVARIDVEAPVLISLTERTDALTGAANRVGVLAHLGVVLGGETIGMGSGPISVGVLVLDLDGFGEVNDELGRHTGDELLAAVAGRLRGTVRFCDLVGRLDADRFVVVAEQEGDPSAVEHVATRVLGVFRRPFRLETGSVQLTGSVGIAIGDKTTSPEALLAIAGEGVLEAKAAGGDCWRRVTGLRLAPPPARPASPAPRNNT